MSTETTQKNSGAPTVFGVIGWIGTLLVFASVGIRFLKPELAQYQQYAAWAGLALVLVYMAGQWRDIATFYEGRGAKYGTLSIVSILVFAAILVAVNYLASRQNKRWDLTSNQVYSLSDQTIKILQTLDAPVKFTVFDQETSLDMHRDRLEAYTYHVAEGHRRVHRSGEEPAARQGRRDHRARHRARGIQGPHRAGHHDRRAEPDQRADQGRHRRDAQGLLHAGPRREGHLELGSHRLQRHRAGAGHATTTASNGCCWRRRAKCPPTPPCWWSRGRRPTSCSPRSTRWPSTWPAAARCWR